MVIIKDQELPKTSKMAVDSDDWYISFNVHALHSEII